MKKKPLKTAKIKMTMFSKIRNYIASVGTNFTLTFRQPETRNLDAPTQYPKTFQPTPFETSSLINRLNKTARYHSELGMQEFRDAISIAENPYQPDRRWLYQIYEVIALDDQVIAQRRVAQNTVKRAPWTLTDEKGKPAAEKKNRMLQKTWFVKFLETFVDTELWGHSLLEFDPTKDDKGEFKRFNLVPREHVRPEYGDIVINVGDMKGIPYRDNPELVYLVEICKDPFDIGLYQAVATPTIYKRYGTMDWARRSERFGSPFLDIKTTSSDQKAINDLEAFAQNFGGNGYIIHDENDTVEMVESTQSDGHKIYAERIALSDSQISKIINGQTGTMDEKAFVGSAEVHERVLNDFVFSRLLDIQNFINDSLIPFLIGHGYQLKGCYFQFEELRKKEQVNENDPNAASDNNQNKEGENNRNATNEKKKPKALTYTKLFYDVQNLYDPQCCELEHGIAEHALGIDLNPYMQAAIKRVYEKKLQQGDLDPDLWKTNMTEIWEAAQQGYGKNLLETKYTDPDKERLYQMQHNAMVFAAFKNHANIADMVKLLKEANGKPRTWESFRDEAQKLNQTYNVNWLQAEWQSANAAARMAAKWNDIKDEYGEQAVLRYETVGDNRVRESHRVLDGVTLPMTDKFWDKHYPPNGWGCRCTVIVEEDDTPHAAPKSLPNDKELPPTFAFNPGKTNKLFGEAHPYYQGFDKNDKANIISQMHKFMRDLPFDLVQEFSNGGSIEIHPTHKPAELPENMKFAKRLAKNKHKVQLASFADDGNKNPDAIIDGVVADFKMPIGTSFSTGLQNAIKDAHKQKANIAIVHVTKKGNASKNEIVKALNAQKPDWNKNINEVWLWIEVGKIDTIINIKREQIFSREYIDLIPEL